MDQDSNKPSELRKLTDAAKLIEIMTGGRLQVLPSTMSHAHIRALDSANIGLEFVVKPNMEQERYEVTFSAHVRIMGAALDSRGLQSLLAEVQESYDLLAALEMWEYHPSQEDMQAFRDFIDRRQEPDPTQQVGPELGQTL